MSWPAPYDREPSLRGDVPLGVDALTVRFGHATALDDVTLRARAGEVTAVVGGDGAGKSTLLRVLAHRVRADCGEVRSVDRTRLGYQPATSGVWPTLTVTQNVEFVGRSYGMTGARIRERSAVLLERAGLQSARNRLGQALSGGMRQKLGFVLAILHEPELVLLDEPSTGVDPVSRVELWRLISTTANEGATIVMATTYLDEAQRAASVLALDRGRMLAAGTPDEIIASVPGAVVRLGPQALAAPGGGDLATSWRRGTERHAWIPAFVPVEQAASVEQSPSVEQPPSERGEGSSSKGDAQNTQNANSASSISNVTPPPGPDLSEPDIPGASVPEAHLSAEATRAPAAATRAPAAATAPSHPSPLADLTPIAHPDFEDALIALSLAADDASPETDVRSSSERGESKGAHPAHASNEPSGSRGHGEGPGRHAAPSSGPVALTAAPTAAAVHITKTFGHHTALDDVGIDVRPGEVVGLIGANGAGKTTLLRILLGLESADSGEATLFGAPPDNASRRRLGYVPQGLGLYTNLSVNENVDFFSRVYGVSRAALHASLPGSLRGVRSSIVDAIGLGRQRQLAFALALGHAPELLVLDEPTSGVDPLARARLWDVIHSQADAGRAVIVTTHYLQEAEQCTRLVLLSQGRLVGTGTVDDLVRGAAAVLVHSADWQRVFERLDGSGLPIMLSGRDVRVASRGAAHDLGERVRGVLAGIPASIQPVPPTLEETMVLLDGDAARDLHAGAAA